jgi:hypothetical protein
LENYHILEKFEPLSGKISENVKFPKLSFNKRLNSGISLKMIKQSVGNKSKSAENGKNVLSHLKALIGIGPTWRGTGLLLT